MNNIAAPVSFEVSRFELALCSRIADRAVAMAAEHRVDYPKRDALMGIIACHANGCPLYLDRLLDAGDADFAHDAFGIRRHLNRRTGELMDCFLPRTAMPSYDAL